MKSDSTPYWPGLLAASRPLVPEIAPQRPDLSRSSSFHSNSLQLPTQSSRSQHSRDPEVTDRDKAVVRLVWQFRVMTDEMIKVCLFDSPNDSVAQHRLTKLYRLGWLDRLPRASVNQPYVYCLSRRTRPANAYLRTCYGEKAFRRGFTRIGSLEHLLGVNWVRAYAMRACQDLGWELKRWQTPEELAPLLGKSVKLVPDGFCHLARPVDGTIRNAGLCLEYQRAVRASRALISKAERYNQLYFSREYEQRFGLRGLRVLIVFSTEPQADGQQRVLNAIARPELRGNELLHFTSLDAIRAQSPAGFFLAPIWYRPDQDQPVSLISSS